MSTEDLRAAARLLRERARAATLGPWARAAEHDLPRDEYPDNAISNWAGEYARCVSFSGTGQGEAADADARYIVLMHPPVALALARALDAMATDCTVLRCEPDVPFTTLARVVLREPS